MLTLLKKTDSPLPSSFTMTIAPQKIVGLHVCLPSSTSDFYLPGTSGGLVHAVTMVESLYVDISALSKKRTFVLYVILPRLVLIVFPSPFHKLPCDLGSYDTRM